MTTLHNFFFNVYPYICLAVFFMGSLARFDRDQHTWKSDSSQLLRKGQLRWARTGGFNDAGFPPFSKNCRGLF